jgi:hypothetical protein
VNESAPGRAIVVASWVGTGAFVVTAAGAAATTAAGARIVATAVALALFTAGIGVFFWAYAIAVGRSRTDAIGIGGLFFLAGRDTAPVAAKRSLLLALGLQVVTAIVTAAARPFTSLAFGVLVPLYGLALCGVYGARHGRFGARSPKG